MSNDQTFGSGTKITKSIIDAYKSIYAPPIEEAEEADGAVVEVSGDSEVLTEEEDQQLAEAQYRGQKSQMARDDLIKLAKEFQKEIHRVNLPDPDSVKYEREGMGQFIKDDAVVFRNLANIKDLGHTMIKALKRAGM